jgi:pimeloyl-ACP methyl ester carboxylesterase
MRPHVLCTCGSRSAPIIVRVTKTLAEVIPTAAFGQIQGAGHAAPFDAPAAFAKIIRDAITTPRGRLHGLPWA